MLGLLVRRAGFSDENPVVILFGHISRLAKNKKGSSLSRPSRYFLDYIPALSFFIFRRFLCRCSRWCRRGWSRLCVRGSGHSFLKAPNPFPQSLCQLRNLSAPEKEQDNRQHDQPMNWTQFTHTNLRAACISAPDAHCSAARPAQQGRTPPHV